ncbi:MAG: hypothetical protein CME62_15255 [Halobacteriovoraceae bacterium]|nr:hypothetical protein [Halobacteriovoraceae bacterium]|tara:strand:+ start:22560 stop:23627 length:1068 start_codon:yes stop_codon:yes gene_type:complete
MKMTSLVAIALFVFVSGVMPAYSVTITVADPTCTGSYNNVNPETNNTFCEDLQNEIRKTAEADLPDVSIGEYGTGVSNANGFAQKGLGSDYSDKFTFFMVRGGAGAAVEGDLEDPESASGFGFGAAVTAGLNLDLLPIDKVGPIELDKMDLFVSFMSYNVDQEDDEFTAEGDLSSFSVMARYQIMDGIDVFPGYMLEWGGVFLHTGIQRSTFKADLSSVFDDQVVDVEGQSATFKNALATFDIETTTTTIPIEVSTYLRTIWALTFYTGAGFDLVSGSTDVSLNADGDVEGGSGGNTFDTTISANESDSGEADATNFRAFGGIQLNIPFVRVYAHINKGLGNDLIGANAGVKILW